MLVQLRATVEQRFDGHEGPELWWLHVHDTRARGACVGRAQRSDQLGPVVRADLPRSWKPPVPPELIGTISGLMVDPDYRHRGLGGQLVDRMVAELGKLGVNTVYLSATPYEREADENRNAMATLVRFYEAHGFKALHPGPRVTYMSRAL